MRTRLEDLSHWIREVFVEAAFHLMPLSGDASFRQYWRLYVDERTYVVMDAPPEKENCLPFLLIGNKIKAVGLSTPEVYHVNLHDGFLVLEDLGDQLYVDRLNENTVRPLYYDAISALIKMQRGIDASSLPEYDRSLLRQELDLFPKWFLQTHLKYSLTRAEETVIDSAFSWIIEEVVHQPRVFVHRDYHSRNLMVVDENNPGIIDYQDAVLGPITYDLVSLLRDVYIAWPSSEVDDWREFYCAMSVESQLLTRAEVKYFPHWFDVMGVQRHLKIAGIFSRLYHRDMKSRYLEDLPLTLNYLLSTVEQFPALREFQDLLLSINLPCSASARNAKA